MFLTPYNRHHEISSFNPFQAMEEMERQFFGESSTGSFKTDIRDDGKEFVLEADLPGHSEYEKKDKKGNYIRCERSYGNFSRSFDLTGIDTEGLSATFADGVLTLKMPKLVETKPAAKKLEIQ